MPHNLIEIKSMSTEELISTVDKLYRRAVIHPTRLNLRELEPYAKEAKLRGYKIDYELRKCVKISNGNDEEKKD